MTNKNGPSLYGEYSNRITDELDEYGVWVKSAPQPIEEPAIPLLSPESGPQPDAPERSGGDKPAPTSDESGFPPDLLKNFLTDIEDIDGADEPEHKEAEQEPETEAAGFSAPPPPPFSGLIETTMLDPPENEAAEPQKAAVMESQDIHADLLHKIADELVSIHAELSGIRQELKLSRNAEAGNPQALEEAAPKPEPGADKALIRDELAAIRQELSRSIAALAKDTPAPEDLAVIRDELAGIKRELSRSVAALAPEVPKPEDLALIRDELAGIKRELSLGLAKPPPESDDDNKHIMLTGGEFRRIFSTMRCVRPEPEEAGGEAPEHGPEPEPPRGLVPAGPVLPVEQARNSGRAPQAEDRPSLPPPEPPPPKRLEISVFDATGDSGAVIDTTAFSEIAEDLLSEELDMDQLNAVAENSALIRDGGDALEESFIDTLLIDNDSAKNIAIEMDEDLLHAAYYQEEEEELLALATYQNEESGRDQDADEPLTTKSWNEILEAAPSPASAPPEEHGPKPEIVTISMSEAVPEKALSDNITGYLNRELRRVLTYMDQVLESLPDEKIEAFMESKHFTTYRQIFKTLGFS